MVKHGYAIKPFVEYLRKSPQSNAHFFNKSTHDSVLARAADIENLYRESKQVTENKSKTNLNDQNLKANAAENQKGAVLKVADNYDLGEIDTGTTTRQLEIKNTGGSELRITAVRSTCRCLTASASKTKLAPGETAEIILEINRKEKDKKTEFKLYIISNDSETKVKKITLKAKLI